MSKKLVFVHGRSQQNKDAKALKGEWIAAFEKGLKKSGLSLPIQETDIRFPYYGDTLAQLTDGANPSTVPQIVVKGPESDAEQEFMFEVLQELAAKEGISDAEVLAEIGAGVTEKGPLNWGWVQGILKVVDRKVPFGSGASVALATKDVYHYLTKPAVRGIIDKGVAQAILANEDTVVVSHSLGTVVAYDVLQKAANASPGWKVPLFVTLGSPLGVKKIRESISPISHPKVASRWFNAMDERDVVALYPLVSPYFGVNPEITNKTDVDNFTENRHGIAGYLSDAVVAKTIYDALQ